MRYCHSHTHTHQPTPKNLVYLFKKKKGSFFLLVYCYPVPVLTYIIAAINTPSFSSLPSLSSSVKPRETSSQLQTRSINVTQMSDYTKSFHVCCFPVPLIWYSLLSPAPSGIGCYRNTDVAEINTSQPRTRTSLCDDNDCCFFPHTRRARVFLPGSSCQHHHRGDHKAEEKRSRGRTEHTTAAG